MCSRRDGVLADDVAVGIEEQAARVVRLADDRRVAGAEDVFLHLLHDPGKPADDDLKGDRVDRHPLGGARYHFACSWRAFISSSGAGARLKNERHGRQRAVHRQQRDLFVRDLPVAAGGAQPIAAARGKRAWDGVAACGARPVLA